jgi:hypothetical protein
MEMFYIENTATNKKMLQLSEKMTACNVGGVENQKKTSGRGKGPSAAGWKKSTALQCSICLRQPGIGIKLVRHRMRQMAREPAVGQQALS